MREDRRFKYGLGEPRINIFEEGVVHYCVTNMPGIVPHTSTYALTNATFSYALAIADHGLEVAARDSAPLRRAINVYDGKITHRGVAEAFGLAYHPAGEALPDLPPALRTRRLNGDTGP